jgi:cysteine desulfuration protein SufE
MDIDEIIENFQFLDDWDDRYKYLIELGSALPEFPVEQQTPENKVQGCVSQVWVTSEKTDEPDPILKFKGGSDAHIVSGLVAITLAIFSDKKASKIIETDEMKIFNSIDLSEHITPQRSNGLRSLVERIKLHAQQALAS